MLVDTSVPIPGWIHDGGNTLADMDFSSDTATVKSVWDGFEDPESNIADYSLNVFVNDQLHGIFQAGTDTSFTDHSIATKHGDRVHIMLEAENGAGLTVVKKTNGYILDETPPDIIHFDGMADLSYQSDDSTLHFGWEFADSESNLKEYRYIIYEEQGGSKHRFLPENNNYTAVELNTNTSRKIDIHLTNLYLQNGARYFIQVTAINNALMSTVVEQHGIIIDITAPHLNMVILFYLYQPLIQNLYSFYC